MRIQSIELENYRQYRDKVLVELHYDLKRNINVVIGANGAGKTNMLNALDWCLYGREDHLDKYSGKKQPIVNDAVLKELGPGQSARARIALRMTDPRGRLYVFERQTTVKKDSNGVPHFDHGDDFHALMQIGHDMEDIPEKEFLINRLLPPAVKNFFFFDGEKLDDFFKEEKSASVRDAILDVSQLSLLDRAIEHLDKTTGSIRSEVKGQSPRVDEIKEQIDCVEKGREHSREQKADKEGQLAKVRDELAKISKKMEGYNEPLVRDLQKQRERIEEQLERLEPSMQEAKTQASENVISVGPLILARNALRGASELIGQKAKKGEIPPKMKETFVRELLDKGECICGSDISKENTARRRVMHLLDEVHISQISEDLLNLKYELNPMLRGVARFIGEQDRYRKNIAELQRQFEEARVNLREVETKLEGISVEEVHNLEIARQQLERQKENLVGDIRLESHKVEVAGRKIEELKAELLKELEKSSKLQTTAAKMKLADDTLEVLTKVKRKLVDDIRSTIQRKTKDYFLSLIWKRGTYDEVQISDDYTISVINKVGSECLGTLSAGERQVLALSFLAALREVSGFDAPVVIDTPLGRISKEPKENIAELLPGFLKETQVTLFVTDEEYTRQVREKLAPRVAKEYELVYDEDRSQTTVKPYGGS